MATKTYKVRLDFKLLNDLHAKDANNYHGAPDVHQWLWDTHVAFNTGVDYLATWLLRMHRGAGVWRERIDGIWGTWKNVSTHVELTQVRSKLGSDPDNHAVIENHELLKIFLERGKTEAEAVVLSECCRRIAERLCPPVEDRDNSQMPRDSLDLLINPFSEARGLRPGPTTVRWELVKEAKESKSVSEFKENAERLVRAKAKQDDSELKRLRNLTVKGLVEAGIPKDSLTEWCLPTSTKRRISKHQSAATSAVYTAGDWQKIRKEYNINARRPGWLQDQVTLREAKQASTWQEFLDGLSKRDEMDSDNGRKRITKLKEMAGRKEASWTSDRNSIKRDMEADTKDYQRLLNAGVLPLTEFGCCHDDASTTLGPLRLFDVGSEWKRSMWDMAGQRVRSHLGWVRRRAGERLLWERRKKLFESGGWKRVRRGGKVVKENDFTAEDILFSSPSDTADFEKQPNYAARSWFTALRGYETVEMPKHAERVAFASAGVFGLTERTVKGWVKVRDRWNDRIKKDGSVAAEELMELVNGMRKRKPRDFGDQYVFEWLAHTNRRWLWDGSECGEKNDCGREDRDCVSVFTAYNTQFSERPESITFTQSHATLHPVWPFFGENSAVKYMLAKERIGEDSGPRLVLCLAQLLARQADGSYQAKDMVGIPLRGYQDFESSFPLADGQEATATQELVFRDDLLAGGTRKGTLSGIKIMWDRGTMEGAQRRHNAKQTKSENRGKVQPPSVPPTGRVYAAFSCDAGEATPSAWVAQSVGKVIKLKKPRDGMTHAFFYDASINKTAKGANGVLLAPGQRRWPREAVENGFCVRGTDLGFRISSAGAWWYLTFDPPKGKVAWPVGHCGEDGRAVFAVLEHQLSVSLPGDGEELPESEQSLRDRLRSLRTRLNLNNTLLRTARLLTQERLDRRVPKEPRMRTRGGITRPNGLKWETTSEALSVDEIKGNCRKAAERFLVWSEKDAMAEALKAIGFEGSIWQWLQERDATLAAITAAVPKTVVPPEKEAKEKKIDREPLRIQRETEDAIFAEAVYTHRIAFARALCDGHDGAERSRAIKGLWAEFDRALLTEISYGDKSTPAGKNVQNPTGLLRLLRKPPVTKHHDRKDDANNLPHGLTHRGGLSMARLNFIDDVKSFVRQWSCRPRWPGDIRRLSEDEKFDRQDTEHLDHLREHRAKLIAHADVAQALGFEQDLRRGVWRFRDPQTGEQLWHRPERGHFYREKNGGLTEVPAPHVVAEVDKTHPHPAHRAAQVLVYEDLSRYKMRADRPKNENAGLARWSHRSILKYAQHIGGLFGVPVATVSAAYSSRFCCRCGAPGCRAVQFNPDWLNKEWMRKVRQSNDIRDARMKGVANQVEEQLKEKPNAFARMEDWPWVLRDGGTHFVCSNSDCSVNAKPVNADENAAANIGLWFLRGVEEFRVKINASGKPTKPFRFLQADGFLKDTSSKDIPLWNISEGKKPQKQAAKDEADEDESDERDGGGTWLFRDPSGRSFLAGNWYEPKWFWNEVARYSAAGIKAANDSRWAELED